ncbi:MAG: AAA family ATPase [Methanobrevibacter sp.]|nr:AAA family ATPase [Candidatus Methanovirga basalitermitum]
MRLNKLPKEQVVHSPNVSIASVKIKKEAKAVVVEGAGFPFKLPFMDVSNLEVNNKELFEIYAKEQWFGSPAVEGNYLFDQKIIPDFGFKIITAYPNNSVIGENTSIILLNNNEDNLKIESNLSLDDVIGQGKAKAKCKVIMKYLDDPEKFADWAPRNILFYGVSGTGKTMLAKALSNELDVSLYLIKATNLIGDHVGDGAASIHDLFEKAGKNSPSVIFIDEIDAIGLHRKYQSIRGDVSEIVNALLTEMDGISNNEGIVTIAATNNPEQLDYGIRSRFEDEFEFTLPDEKERRSIFNKYIDTLPIPIKPTTKQLAKLTKGFSGRDIKEKVLKSSLHKAISEEADEISMEHVNYALSNYYRENNSPKNMFA